MYLFDWLNLWPILVLLLHFVCAILASEVARTKGHSTFAWVMGGLILGPLGLIAATGLGNRRIELLLRELAAVQGGRSLTKQEVNELKWGKLWTEGM